MIEPANIFRDVRSDEVGIAIKKLRCIDGWTKDKHSKKDELIKILKNKKYKNFMGNSNRYLLKGGTGFSIIYQVPNNKRGQLQCFRGLLIRIILTYRYKMDSYFSALEVHPNQKGSDFLTKSLTHDGIEFDWDAFIGYKLNREEKISGRAA